jgi:predicted ribosome quality control (RQC) complex YloA/Tae2 family protein
LVLSFLGDNQAEVHLIANLGSDFSCLYFPKDYHRAKRNSITLFDEIIGLRVESIAQLANERLFVINFQKGFRLAFKLFGNRSNIILFKNNELVSLFKSNLKQDAAFNIAEAGREIDFSWHNFKHQEYNLHKVFYTLGEVPILYLNAQGYESKTHEEQFSLIENLLVQIENPEFYITSIEGKVRLSLLDMGEVLSKHQFPIEAINAFYSAHYRYNYLEKQRLKVMTLLDSKIKAGTSYVNKIQQKVKDLTEVFPPEKIADIIMANLHAIPTGTEKITLYDFYRNQDIELLLKKDVSPQKQAEAFYKKSKKRPAEVKRLEEQVEIKEKELLGLLTDKQKIEAIETHKELDPYIQKYIHAPQKEQENPITKFKECEFMGYKIYVGKNADNNDELTQKYAAKDDLWLHAKDVQGSHVVVKYKSGQNFPKNVIEKAASLAAYYSKRRNESLCPVMYTQKKYVRKIKGAAKGAVRVERETVIMVVPGDF